MNSLPRISTRGYYDLSNGKTVKKNSYFTYPKKDFKKLTESKELVIMIHGLRNDNNGAVAKIKLAKKRLRKLGYVYPVIGFSYDSNTKGAHLITQAKRALCVGQTIAKKNGRNLGLFIEDFKKVNPKTKIRLMGHSLGSQVILSTIEYLAKKNKKQNINLGIVESVHLFGASITEDIPSSRKYKKMLQDIVNKKIVNHYAPTDEVLAWANKEKFVHGPLGLCGAIGTPPSKYHQKLVKPKNHRFASYVDVLNLFP